MASRDNSIAVATETRMRNNIHKHLRESYLEESDRGYTMPSFENWLKRELQFWHCQGRLNYQAYEEGSSGFYFAIVCSEFLEPIFTTPKVERPLQRPLPWFKQSRLNRHLRRETLSRRLDFALPKKMQISQGQTRLFPL